MTVKIDQFGGIAPRQHPTQLADGMATVSHNCRLKTGKLVPLRQPEKAVGKTIHLENGMSKVGEAKTMHIWRKQNGDFDFLCFPGVTWLAEGNIADDEKTRVIVSGATGVGESGKEPCIYLRNGTAKVVHRIIKSTLPAPEASRADGAPELTDNRRYTRFFYTWVDDYGYESPCSEPGGVLNTAWTPGSKQEKYLDLEYMDGDTINFTAIGSENMPAEASSIRVYKVVTGMETGRIQFIGEFSKNEIGGGDTGFSIKVKDEDAGEIMPEIEAPLDDLSCIHDVPGAFYCGFSPSMPKTVCFSDVNLLYSWPVAYRYDVKDNIVALAVTSNTVFALTDGWPYVLSGTAPEAMTVSKLAGPAACVSPRGVTVYRNAVYYVSNVGLMTIFNSADAGTVCQNLTQNIFTKEQWLAMKPETCIMGQFDGALFLFFDLGDGAYKGLTIDLLENSQIAVSTHDEIAKCLAVDTAHDKLYFVREVA